MDRFEFWNGQMVLVQVVMPGTLTGDKTTWGRVIVTRNGSGYSAYSLERIGGMWQEVPHLNSGKRLDDFGQAYGIATVWALDRWSALERETRENTGA